MDVDPNQPTPPDSRDQALIADVKLLRLRRADVCACGQQLTAGTRAGWDRSTRRVVCPACLQNRAGSAPPTLPDPSNGPDAPSACHATTSPPPEQPDTEEPDTEELDVGTPGASLQREYERRKHAREDRIRLRHPRLGGLILALSREPASTVAFASGALGERQLAARLENDCADQVLFLHNRRLGPGRRDGDVDHLAVGPTGVFVIDAKRYPNARVRVRRSGGLFSPAREQLLIDGRDRSRLLDGCARQVAAVSQALAGHPLADAVSITGLLCFVDADLPLRTRTVKGTPLLGPRRAAKVLQRPGTLTPAQRLSLHQHLARALPPA